MSNGPKWEILQRRDGGVMFSFWDWGVGVGDACIDIAPDGTVTVGRWDENEEHHDYPVDDLAKFLLDWTTKFYEAIKE
jgi:hypothetical protein